MKWTLEQMHRIEDLQRWYRQKTDRLFEALENGKVKIESYWDDCRKLIKNVRSDNSLREWQIVFENMENIINNKYIDRLEVVEMKKFRTYLEKWINGEKVRGINVSLYDIQECVRIYNAMVQKEKPSFINGKVKEILDKCNIKTVEEGIGWRVA